MWIPHPACSISRRLAEAAKQTSTCPDDADWQSGVLGLSPDRTASLPGGLSRKQLRSVEPRPDRFGLLNAQFSQNVLMSSGAFRWPLDFRKVRFGRVHGISSPGMLSTSENVDLGDASVGVARNPLRDGALPTGHFAVTLLSARDLLPLSRQIHEGHRLTSSCRGSARSRPG